MPDIIKILLVGFALLPWLVLAKPRDPTQPSTMVIEAGGSQQLTAIIVSPQRKIAVINDEIVKIGDIVLGKKVIAIEPSSVILEDAEGRTVLSVYDLSIKTEKSRE